MDIFLHGLLTGWAIVLGVWGYRKIDKLEGFSSPMTRAQATAYLHAYEHNATEREVGYVSHG